MPKPASLRRAAWHLSRLGWRIRSTGDVVRAIEDLQRGWNLGPALVVDGVLGPKTMSAILASSARRRRGLPTASPHFSWTEARCKCGGRYAGCRTIRVHRALWQSLEEYRTAFCPRGLPLISVYRCPGRNAAVGGARLSQHMAGLAADIPSTVTSSRVRALAAFGGIGITARTDTVAHVDRRDLAGGPSVTSPATWFYN